MSHFGPAYRRSMLIEKGYVFHPQDRGGETFCGVARKYWPSWPVWRYIDYLKSFPDFPQNIPYSQLEPYLRSFYRENFWTPIEGIADQDIANQVYDTAVNSGLSASVKILQHSLNLLNRGGTDYPDIEVDGVFGNESVQALNTLLLSRPKENLLFLLWHEQLDGWIDLVRADESQEQFLNGWLKRFQHNISGVSS